MGAKFTNRRAMRSGSEITYVIVLQCKGCFGITLYQLYQDIDNGLCVKLQFGWPQAFNSNKLVTGPRVGGGDFQQRRIMENHIRRQILLRRFIRAPLP